MSTLHRLCDRVTAPTLDPSELAELESHLPRLLPPFLRAMLTQVGDGGYGFAYGHLRLGDALELWRGYADPNPDDRHWNWPQRLLPYVELGCGMSLCVDLCTEDIVLFEPNGHVDGEAWSHAFVPLGMDLETLMRHWLDDHDLDAFLEQAWNAHNPGSP